MFNRLRRRLGLTRRRKPLSQRVDQAKDYLHEGGLHENPDDNVVYLLLQEVRSLNNRVSYMLGALGVVVALFLAHVLVGIGDP